MNTDLFMYMSCDLRDIYEMEKEIDDVYEQSVPTADESVLAEQSVPTDATT